MVEKLSTSFKCYTFMSWPGEEGGYWIEAPDKVITWHADWGRGMADAKDGFRDRRQWHQAHPLTRDEEYG